jgi:pimeloyl-ACP methyl ester carboxylesterase
MSYRRSRLICVRVTVDDGVALEVRRLPGERRPAFLLVHGLASNARLWDEVATRLSAAGHPTAAVDLRGHGESDSPDRGYDTATAASDLVTVIGALDLGRPIVVGQSWGGNVVVSLAAQHPELVSALALVDGGWADLEAEFGTWEACERALMPGDVTQMRADKLRSILRISHPDWSATAVEATVANLRVGPGGRLSRRLPVERHMQIVRSMFDDPPKAYHPKLTMPVLLMPAPRAGRPLASRARFEAAAAAIPKARVHVYEGADHDLHAQHPEAVASDLLSLVGAT